MARTDPKEQPWEVATEGTQRPAQDGFLEWDEKTKLGVQTQLIAHQQDP